MPSTTRHNSRLLAGSRLHVIDIVVTRALVSCRSTPGLRRAGIYTLSRLRLFLAVFIHANVRIDVRPLDWVLSRPLPPLHHAAHPEAVDKNFAVHLP